MSTWDAVTEQHVRQAMAECDDLGDEEFLARHGFEQPRTHVVWDDSKPYDSRAVLAVAHSHATGRDASTRDFSDAAQGAEQLLRDLGFQVDALDVADGTDGTGGSSGTGGTAEIGPEELRLLRAAAARILLLETARVYGSFVTHKELGAYITEEVGDTPRQLLQHWIAGVLRAVAEECASRGEPMLTALCVDASGSIGKAYAEAVLALQGVSPDDPDQHAAEERLRCYTFFGANLPAGGGFPSLTPKLTTSRARAKKLQREARPLALCPTCQLVVPPSGICDNCD